MFGICTETGYLTIRDNTGQLGIEWEKPLFERDRVSLKGIGLKNNDKYNENRRRDDSASFLML